ncbi:MAG: hypothetical protein WCS22_04245 [Acholeplasmataceae bacterium]|jgi:hypothetical protein
MREIEGWFIKIEGSLLYIYIETYDLDDKRSENLFYSRFFNYVTTNPSIYNDTYIVKFRKDEFVKDRISEFFILGTTKSEGSLTVRSMNETDIENTILFIGSYFKVNTTGLTKENFFKGSGPKS